MGSTSPLLYLFIAVSCTAYSNGIGCGHNCQNGLNLQTTNCYTDVGCFFSFPSISFLTTSVHVFRLEFNFTETAANKHSSRVTFVYSGMLWLHENHTVNRYLFQVDDQSYLQESQLHVFIFTFSILNLKPRDTGSYHLSLAVDYIDNQGSHLMQHTYRLITILYPGQWRAQY